MSIRKTLFVLFFLPFFASADYVVKPFTLPSGIVYWAVQQVVGPIKAQASELTPYEEMEMIIKSYSDVYGASRLEMLETINCESDFVKFPIEARTIEGDRGDSFGPCQFNINSKNGHDTFLEMKNLAIKEGQPFEKLERLVWKDQIRLMAYIFGTHPELKTRWTCYNLIFVKKTRPISTNW